MKKIILFCLLNTLITTQCATPQLPNPKWLSGKINNTTSVPVQITINYTPDCSKIFLQKDKSDCLAQGYSLTLTLEPTKAITISDYIGVVDSYDQYSQDGTFSNSIYFVFPAPEGEKTYAPISVVIAQEDLQKIKTYSIRFFSGKMSVK